MTKRNGHEILPVLQRSRILVYYYKIYINRRTPYDQHRYRINNKLLFLKYPLSYKPLLVGNKNITIIQPERTAVHYLYQKLLKIISAKKKKIKKMFEVEKMSRSRDASKAA